jgi:O-antigen ligase
MTVALSNPPDTGFTVPAAVPKPRARAGRIYLVLSALLAPVVVPAGPAQTAVLDVVNLFAIVAFFMFVVAPGRQTLRVPLVVPMALVAIGSLIACAWAPSLSLAALAMAQDVYLFVWFIVLVNLVRTRSELRLVRVAWVWAAVLVSLGALAQLLLFTGGSLATLLGSRGIRPGSTLYNPNMLADYLMMSVFVALSLAADLKRVTFLAALGIMGMALLATKSNGGMIAFAAGSLAWAVAMVATGPAQRRGSILAATVLLASLAGVGLWLGSEYGLGDRAMASLSEHTFVGRMGHSSESRLRIWDQLEQTYARSPLGLGPGNSASLTMGIADRERPDSYRSKEAHSDYLAYAIERGPLGLVGLLGLMIAMLGQIGVYWRGAQRSSGLASRRARLWTASMIAILAGSAVHSLVIEKLHFRHYWLFIALLCSSALMSTLRVEGRAQEAA